MRPMLASAAVAVLLWTAPALAQETETAPPTAPVAAAPSPEAASAGPTAAKTSAPRSSAS